MMGNFWPDVVVGNETLIKSCFKIASCNGAVKLSALLCTESTNRMRWFRKYFDNKNLSALTVTMLLS